VGFFHCKISEHIKAIVLVGEIEHNMLTKDLTCSESVKVRRKLKRALFLFRLSSLLLHMACIILCMS
jgi:hypothetical protein